MNNTKDLLIGTMDNHKVYLKASEIILLCSEEVRKENDELKMQNEKLIDDLNNCIMSNELLERENNNLRHVLSTMSYTPLILDGDDK